MASFALRSPSWHLYAKGIELWGEPVVGGVTNQGERPKRFRYLVEANSAWARLRANYTEVWSKVIWRWLERLVLGAVAIFALSFVWQYGEIVFRTIAYAYHLEWMEGGVVQTVDRVLAGKAIYGPPALEYVPYLYTPLYYWVCGLFSTVLGVGFFACRLVSFFSAVGVALVLADWCRRETGNWAWGALAIALWFATYDASGRWFHLARVDTFALCMSLSGAYLLRFFGGARSAGLAGCLLFLAFLTKQSSLVSTLPVLAVVLVSDGRRGLIAGVPLGLGLVVTMWVGQHLTGGWWWFWLVDLPGLHPQAAEAVVGFWTRDLWRVAVLVALACFGVFANAQHGGQGGAFSLAWLFGGVLMSYLSRMHSGGYLNVLMPAHLVVVLYAVVGCARLSRELGAGERRSLGGSSTVVGLGLLLILQLQGLSYATDACIPAPEAEAQGLAFERELAQVGGDVLVPDQRWVPSRAGQVDYGLGMAARDVYRITERDHPVRLGLLEAMGNALAARRFAAVVTSVGDSAPGLKAHYRLLRRVVSPRPVTGWQNHPRELWVPKAR